MSSRLPPEAHLGDAEFDEWARRPSWTIHEAKMLVVGLNPQIITPDSMLLRSNALAPEIHRSLDLAQRAFQVGQLPQHCPPATFIELARTHDIEIDARVIAAVEARGIQISDRETKWGELNARCEELQAEVAKLRAAVREPNAKERVSLLKLVLGLAIIAYRYTPDTGRSSVNREIADDLAEQGLTIDEDTVRKHLDQAVELVWPGTKED